MKKQFQKFVASCSLIGLIMLSIGAVNAQQPYDKLKLTDYYLRQDFDRAVEYLKSMSAGNANATAFNNDLGYALFMNDQPKEAKVYFQMATLADPDNIEANLYLAQIFAGQGNLDSALFFYKVLTRSNPQQYRFWQKAGSAFYRLSEYDSALAYYLQAYKLNNRSGRVAVELSNLFVQRKQINRADSLLQEFLRRDTLDEDVIAKKIEISFKQSVYDTVIYWGEKLWRDSSILNQPFTSLAFSYLNKGQFENCIKLCDWLELGNRAGQPILYCGALALTKTGRYIESNAKLDLCLKMSIQDDAHTYLAAKGDNFENLKDYKTAIHYYDTAWYIFQQPFDLYFAGRIYDKFYSNKNKAAQYYRMFQKNRTTPKNSGEKRVSEYVDGYLNDIKVKKNR